MNTKDTTVMLGVLVVAALMGLSSCSSKQQAKVSAAETVRDVSVVAVKQANVQTSWRR